MIVWLVETLVASTVLMGVVLVVRGPVRRGFGARTAYALWLLPALRMILPPLPGRHWLTIAGASLSPGAEIREPVLTTMAQVSGPLPTVVRHGALLAPSGFELAALLPGLLLALWLAGAVLAFGLAVLRYHMFLRRVLARAVRLSVECGVEVLASPDVPGPVATGLVRRRILLPADFLARYTPEERRLALLHEGAHHDRLDMVANAAALVVRALHWWNPIAAIAHGAFRADQELACDATVLADSRNSRAAYGRALLKSAVARTPGMVCAFNRKADLKQRLGTLARAPLGRARLVAGGLLAGAMVIAGTVATAWAVPPSPPVPPALPALASPPAPPLPAAYPMAPAPIAPAMPAAAPHRPAAAHRTEWPQPAADIDRAAREEERVARQAVREADRQAARAARDAAVVARAAGVEARTNVHASLAATRASMALDCAAQGRPVPSTADMRTLALCGRDIGAEVRAEVAAAQRERMRALQERLRDRAYASTEPDGEDN